LPAARSRGLVVEQLGEETLIYDLERDEAHHLNPTAAAVFGLCDGQTTIEELATEAAERLGQPLSVQIVDQAVEQLAERGLLSHGLAPEVGVSRREVVRRAALVGAGAAVAGPVIKSIVAPTPAMAQSNGQCKVCEETEECGPGEECVSFDSEGKCCRPLPP